MVPEPGPPRVARQYLAVADGFPFDDRTVEEDLLALLPATLVTAMIVTELVAMPVIVSVVQRAYPGLRKAGGSSALGSVANAGLALAVFALLWLVTLPLWLTGVGAVVLPALNAAYLNQRIFRYDALADHASAAEYRAIVEHARATGIDMPAATVRRASTNTTSEPSRTPRCTLPPVRCRRAST